jgi:hypothetical protein
MGISLTPWLYCIYSIFNRPVAGDDKMKQSGLMTECEFCGKQFPEHDLSENAYESAKIQIRNGSILLPKVVVKKNHKKGICDSHASYLNGQYCSPKCLIGQIEKILKLPQGGLSNVK